MHESSTTGVVCSIKCCKNFSINFSHNKLGSLSFWRFPKEATRCSKWVQRCQRKDLKNILELFGPAQLNEHHFVCSDHFSQSDYVDFKNVNRGLTECAVPSLSLVPIVQTPEPGEIVITRKRSHQNYSRNNNEKPENSQKELETSIADTVNSLDPLKSLVIPPKVVSVDTYFSNRYGKSGAKCVVFDCDNYICQQNAPSYYRFPNDSKRCQEWLTILDQPNLFEKFKSLGLVYCYKNFRVCSDHFKKEDFKNPKMKSQGILRDAKPSLKLGRRISDKQKATKQCSPITLSPPLNDDLIELASNTEEEAEHANNHKPERLIALNIKDANLSRLQNIIQTQETFPQGYLKDEYSSEFHNIVDLSKANKKLTNKLRDFEVHTKIMSEKVIKYQRQISRLRSRNIALRKENRSLKATLKPQAPIILKMQQPPAGTIPRYILQPGTIPVTQAKIVKARTQTTLVGNDTATKTD